MCVDNDWRSICNEHHYTNLVLLEAVSLGTTEARVSLISKTNWE